MGSSNKFFVRGAIFSLLAALSMSSISCVVLRGSGSSAEVSENEQAERGRSQIENRLRRIVRSDFQEAGRSQDDSSRKLIFRKPFYYKERVEYPQGSDSFRIVIHEKESRTAPYSAEVTIRKIRYSTARHKKKADAQEDTIFQRDTGVETVSYQYRAGKWKRIGSMFVAESRGENTEGS